MAHELPDRQHCLFGREGDLVRLRGRARFKGLTAVVARPQMGKSWLLNEFARRLAQEHEPPLLVGFAESAGQTPDLLLRAVVDLYIRWLADAGYRQQAKMVWEQQSGNVLPGVAKAVAKMIKEAGQIANPITGIVEDAINGLIATNQTLTTGGIQLPALQYDQARDLVSLTYRISGRRIALILDQWEQSPDPRFEAKTLNAFLHHLDDWPPCHVILALRPDEPAYGEVEKLAKSLPGTAEIYPLQEMKLDLDEGYRLTAFVRRTVPAAVNESDDDLLGLIDGYPGVVYQWTRDYQRAHMQTLIDLQEVADDAQEYRFSDLSELLPELGGDRRRLAIRLALLPVGDGELFGPLASEILANFAQDSVDDLRLSGVLEHSDPPSFGHAKRWEAAWAWFVEHRRAATRTEAEALILRLAAPVHSIEPRFVPNFLALWGLRFTTRELKLSGVATALCELVGLGENTQVRSGVLISGARQAGASEFAAIAPLLAIGLSDALNQAKAEDDLARRDALLEELRALAGAHPEDAAVRAQLARGLFATVNYAKNEDDLARRDALLEELRALAGAHPEDAGVRAQLARGLFNTQAEAKAEDDLARRDALLVELRALAGAHPEDAGVREPLARGLFNTLNQAKAEDDLARRDALLVELRALARAHPEDAAVREPLASGLVNTQIDAKAEDDLARRDALLEELRALAGAYPEDAAVREPLARGLSATLNDAKAEDDLARRDALLEELRALAGAHPEDAAVREQLARGLFDTVNYAKAEDDLARRDALLEELRALAGAHPEDAAVRAQLASGLVNTQIDAKDEDDLARRDALLEELRALAGAHPEDASIREPLANGLANSILDAADEEQPERQAKLREQLSDFADAHPEDGWVEQFRSEGLL